MSTIILLDVSLSMCRPANKARESSNVVEESAPANDRHLVDLRQLANVGIGTLLDYFAQNVQLEKTALVVFSSLWELKHDFTRHHESIKNGIYDLELYDKSNVVNAIRGILQLKCPELAQTDTVNIILITDGQLHHEVAYDPDKDELIDQKEDDFHDLPLSHLENQFDFPCKIQVVCLGSQDEPLMDNSIAFYKRLVGIVDKTTKDCSVLNCNSKPRHYGQSAIWFPETDNLGISIASIEKLFTLIAEVHYKPHRATLQCGHLGSLVLLSPKPKEYTLKPLKNEFDDLKETQGDNKIQVNKDSQKTFVDASNSSRVFRLSNEINICGFLPIADIASPAVTSRHIVMPIPNARFDEVIKAEQILSQDPKVYSSDVDSDLMQTFDPLKSNSPLDIINLKSQIELDQHQSSTSVTNSQDFQAASSKMSSCNSDIASNRKTTSTSSLSSSSSTSMDIDKKTTTTSSATSTNTKSNGDLKSTTGSNNSNNAISANQPDLTKQPSFCVLLHNALRQENMVAICQVGRDINDQPAAKHALGIGQARVSGGGNSNETTTWFGILHAQLDSKKRSTLMLSLLIPDDKPILWLPNFKTMGTSMLNADLPQAIRDKMNAASSGPRKQLKSYSSNNVIWLDPESVQADLQKVVRHARRSIDKVSFFYKELNRIRKAAISYGFYDVLFGLASILEREKSVMLMDTSKEPNHEMIAHIDHAILKLREPLTEDSFQTNIAP